MIISTNEQLRRSVFYALLPSEGQHTSAANETITNGEAVNANAWRRNAAP